MMTLTVCRFELKFILNKGATGLRLRHTWIQPKGSDIGVKLYNCVSKKKVPLVTESRNILKWYTCGPTVYDSAHVGHASCYIKVDILQRILKSYFNCNVVSAMNITDIDDKIILKANALKDTPDQIAKKYENEFWADLESLDVVRPNLILRVTEHINIIKEYIATLYKQGFAYTAKDRSVYFNTGKLTSYGKLQNVTLPLQNHPEEDPPQEDFVLWKAAKPGEPFWDSEWGPGRPGWHSECAALAGTVFGKHHIIIYTGCPTIYPLHTLSCLLLLYFTMEHPFFKLYIYIFIKI